MELEKSNNHSNNFQNFIKVQKEIMETFCDGANVTQTVLQLDELFKFFDEHFDEFHQKDNLCVTLVSIHRCLKLWISRGDYLKDDIGILLINFIGDHREDENDLNIVVQIVYQILSSIKYFGNNEVPISEKLLRELNITVTSIKCRTLISCCLACIQLYMKMFPESCKILTSLWSNIKSSFESNLKLGIIQDTELDILIQLIDDFKAINSNFHDEPVLVGIVQHLLKSDQRKYRKCGYFLLKKVFQYFIQNINTVAAMWLSIEHKNQIESSWIMYITILENLEEEQSHLIIPSLENLEELIKSKHLKSSWLDILYMRILTHNNNLVLRWSIELFLKTFTCSDLSADILKYLLQATNSNLLYNYEGYFLNRDLLPSFLQGDLINVLTMLPEIENWKSVPLYVWLENLNGKVLPKSLNLEVVLKISACVRKLQHFTIRQKTIEMCHKLFDAFVKKMTMAEYVTYVETLYNSSDNYSDHKTFFNKKSSLIDSEAKSSIFKQRFYEIFTNNEWDQNELLLFLNDIRIELHGWLKFALFNLEPSECNQKQIKNLYNIDLNSLTYCDLHKVINIFENCFLDSPPYNKYEQRECQCAAISFYIYQKSDFENEVEDTLRFILNSGIKHKVLDTLAKRFLDNSDKVIDLWFIDELLKDNNSKNLLECVSNYLRRVYDDDVVYKYAVTIFEKYTYISSAFTNINLLKHCTDKLFKELASKGEKRIEQAFCFNHFGAEISDLWILTRDQIIRNNNMLFLLDLLKYHTDLTKKKPRYFENSTEHRTKLRIAICIYFAIKHIDVDVDVLDQMWNIVLNENNQLNIIYIYEFILGIKENRIDFILNKLKEAQSLTSSQQVSIISVALKFFLRNYAEIEHRKSAVSYLLALTMGANFQTRLFAQMSLIKLLQAEHFSERLECSEQLIQSIEYATGTKLNEYLNDIRMQICTFSENASRIMIIQYVTNTPFDELSELFNLNSYTEDIAQVELCRETFMKKIKVTTNEDTMPKSTINDQIQRKMNPVNDLTEPHNLIIYPTEEKPAEMFVVASLIDKLPNLGGIARTCEVLGIHNLVMDSKMDTSKNDFKNLSMTAEKTLNIVEVKPKDLKEFLMNKKLQGYAIVGAEQTCNSKNFSNFKFPQKCVLLLGHEKDGIPAPLLGLLDYAVEIPQFGQIRSLNVHVTGALFMWEFCKQHLVQEQ